MRSKIFRRRLRWIASLTIAVPIIAASQARAQHPVPNDPKSGIESASAGNTSDDVPIQSQAQSSNAPPDSSNYVIGSDDVLNIHVWHQTEISGPVTVRPDGKITMPLIGEIQAAGSTPPQLQNAIAGKLRSFVNDPEVTVIVQAANSKRFNVMGRVARPGSYSLATRMRVLDGIAAAGGFADFAKVTKVYVLRPTKLNGVQKLPFNYKLITQDHDNSENVELQPGDTVVVP